LVVTIRAIRTGLELAGRATESGLRRGRVEARGREEEKCDGSGEEMSSVGPKARRTTTPGVGGEESRDHRRIAAVVELSSSTPTRSALLSSIRSIRHRRLCRLGLLDRRRSGSRPSRWPPHPPPLKIHAVTMVSSTSGRRWCSSSRWGERPAAVEFVADVGRGRRRRRRRWSSPRLGGWGKWRGVVLVRLCGGAWVAR
jgi:hypothetical protein